MTIMMAQSMRSNPERDRKESGKRFSYDIANRWSLCLLVGMLDSHDGKPGAQFDRIRKNIRLDRYKPLVEVNQANKILVVLDKDIQFN